MNGGPPAEAEGPPQPPLVRLLVGILEGILRRLGESVGWMEFHTVAAAATRVLQDIIRKRGSRLLSEVIRLHSA